MLSLDGLTERQYFRKSHARFATSISKYSRRSIGLCQRLLAELGSSFSWDLLSPGVFAKTCDLAAAITGDAASTRPISPRGRLGRQCHASMATRTRRPLHESCPLAEDSHAGCGPGWERSQQPNSRGS